MKISLMEPDDLDQDPNTNCPKVFEEASKLLKAPQPMAFPAWESVAKFFDEHKNAFGGVKIEFNQMYVLLNPGQTEKSKEEVFEKLDPGCREALRAIPGSSLLGFRYNTTKITLLGPQK